MSDSAAATGTAGSADDRGADRRSGAPRRERSGNPVSRAVRRLVTFYRQVVAELRKVIWPTRRELVTYTSVVLVFVIFMVALVALFDFGAAQGVLAVFGDG